MKELSLSGIILERFVNIHNGKDLVPYIDDVWEILQQSYAPIGGFATASTKEELMRKTGFAKLVRRDGRIIAAALYKDDRGRKAIGAGSDGTDAGKSAVKQIIRDDMRFDRAWAEASGAMEKIMLRDGGIPIPNTMVASILGKEILELNPDGYHYTRVIGGEPHEKILIGKIKE